MDHSDNLSVLFRISEVVAGSNDLEEAILQVMEEMSEKYGMLQAILTLLNRNSSNIF
jgi:hypothetical protein